MELTYDGDDLVVYEGTIIQTICEFSFMSCVLLAAL